MAAMKKNRAERRREQKLNKKNRERNEAHEKNTNQLNNGIEERLLAIEKLRRSGQIAIALQVSQQLLSVNPDNHKILFAVGALKLELKKYDSAYPHLKQAVEISPERGDYWLRFAVCLYEMGQVEAARIAAINSVSRNPKDLNTLHFLGVVCREADDSERALQAYETILALKPDDGDAMFGRARCLMIMGRIDESEQSYLKALEIDPDSFSSYQNLLKNKSKKVDVNELRRRAEHYLTQEIYDDSEYVSACFALAYLEDREKKYGKAFEYFKRGNAIQSSRRPFDEDSFLNRVDSLIDGFSSEAIEKLSAGGSRSGLPVFIVGMPRSGTTLTEQILSSHSIVHGAGELLKVSHIFKALSSMRHQGFAYPQDIGDFDPAALADLGEQYLEVAMRNAPAGTERVVDKLPGNIVHLGLIGVMFPNATLIHCMRDPMDTAISCFTQNFKDDLNFATDLTALGVYYRETLRLMDHWKKIFPGRILEVQYEKTVEDQEAMSRKLIAHAGLDWEDQCLNFHETERSVQTASLWQVRQPIYKTSVQRWRRYEKHLGPLIDALGEHGPGAKG